MSALTPQEKRTRIAEALGFIRLTGQSNNLIWPCHSYVTGRDGPIMRATGVDHLHGVMPPDYFGDLNAALSAVRASREKLTDSESWSRFAILLEEHHKTAVLEDACNRLDYFELADFLSSLTAADYSEALGLALGLWKEGE